MAGRGGRTRCVRACVGGDSENESCRIRFGSETRDKPTERRVLQTAGRFITRCSLYLTPVSCSGSPPFPFPPEKMAYRWTDKGKVAWKKRREKRIYNEKEMRN